MGRVSRLKQIAGIVSWLVITFIAAAIGGAGSINAGSFYDQLALPQWAPPSSLFGPVWTLLYALMGIAAWLVWRVDGFFASRGALTLFLIQLVPNALWSWLFFVWKFGMLSLANIVLLWILILATMVFFRRVRPMAGALLLPYLLWVSFATALNYSIWKLNPGILS
jgi:tryptophan-rich sensory protein